jgi:hypothetical protein
VHEFLEQTEPPFLTRGGAATVTGMAAPIGVNSVSARYQRGPSVPVAAIMRGRHRPTSAREGKIRATQRLLPAVPLFSTDKPTNWLIPWRLSSSSTLP